MSSKLYYVYILTNKTNSVLYTGVTNNLTARVYQHKNKLVQGFTFKYNVTKLAYFETCSDVSSAITREKQIKEGSRKKKIELVNSNNPKWIDLYNDLL
jgi:putative endonuclease